MRVALFQPGIPQNVGAAIRLAACFGVGLDVIEPCSFPLGRQELEARGPGLWAFGAHETPCFVGSLPRGARTGRRPAAAVHDEGATPFHHFEFQSSDTLLFGNESRGAPDEVHDAAQGRLVIPLRPEARSMNLATTVSMALGEALRQTGGFFEG
jgi:tRNA (cytidine/uridine-2'-O-)-methyltransferase